jgi:hypothetical protein
MTKYELELRMDIDDAADQPVTLVLESFDTVMLRTDAHLYILQATRQDRETGPLKALHDIFLCKHHPPPLPIPFAEDSWFRMDALKTVRKERRSWNWLAEVDAPTMQIATAIVTWGWCGHNGKHSAFDLFTFVRVDNCRSRSQ